MKITIRISNFANYLEQEIISSIMCHLVVIEIYNFSN